MPTTSPLATLQDPFLEALDRLPDNQLLTSAQVGILLQVSIRWLEDQRGASKPPPWIELGPRMVRYAVGPLRGWMNGLIEGAPASSAEKTQRKTDAIAGLDEPILKGGRRKRPAQQSYGAFMSTAQRLDEWPFAIVGQHKRPIDFITALAMELNDDDACEWLTLEHYIALLKESTQDETQFKQAQAERANLSDKLPEAPERKRTPL
ncbi:hypothetical protein [Dyella sp.]|uniref:hypothetical protein n=1 Tax=Dyella sp. TaxID=1869338 RepID=UPI002D7721F0|nr:hypothetical protein [Dyella sp.]HET7329900.1 hypothetical protein [Dyella sp.]